MTNPPTLPFGLFSPETVDFAEAKDLMKNGLLVEDLVLGQIRCVSNDERDLDWPKRLLLCFAGPNLKNLDIDLDWHCSVEVGSYRWDALLAFVKSYPKLQAVTVRLGFDYIDSNTISNGPELQARAHSIEWLQKKLLMMEETSRSEGRAKLVINVVEGERDWY